MQGAGNDYVYVDAISQRVDDPCALAVGISDRHFGVGSDGLVLITSSTKADFGMRMFNADGSEAGMCGNASRCVGKYLYERGFTNRTKIALETASGIKVLNLQVDDDRVEKVSVDMDSPKTDAGQIPVLYPQAGAVPVEVCGRSFQLTCVSMGNPHAVAFVDDVDGFEVERIGRAIECHPLFPERCNVEFAQVLSGNRIKMRVWERGSGETLACGTGACATLVAGVLNGKCERQAEIVLRGGEVSVWWDLESDHVILTGGAEWVFSGEYFLA